MSQRFGAETQPRDSRSMFSDSESPAAGDTYSGPYYYYRDVTTRNPQGTGIRVLGRVRQ